MERANLHQKRFGSVDELVGIIHELRWMWLDWNVTEDLQQNWC